MGRGNYCPAGDCTDQWYVEYDQYDIIGEDETPTGERDYDLMMEDFDLALRAIIKRFPSFDYVNGVYGDRYWDEEYRLENKLFRIGIADNTWSLALFLQMRRDLEPDQETLARRHFAAYSKAILTIMLETFGQISLRSGAWCSRTVRLETPADHS